MPDLKAVLGPEGLLASRIPGFSFRPQQLAMAEAVARTLREGGTLITEAGTGTGKTFAYLVPALMSGQKTIVSTGTKNLQDQLFHRDLPLVRQALSSPARLALLKGRSNYLCLQRLEDTLLDGRHRAPRQLEQLQRVREWAGRTRSGDIAEVGLPEDTSIWPSVTSTSDNCLGPECPSWGRCHLLEARRRAQAADLVVINHHLFCADLALKDEGFGEVLPGADAFVLDEAHQLPDVASSFFGLTVSGWQLLELVRDAETEYHREAGDLPEIPRRLEVLRKAVQDLRLSFGTEPRRGPWGEIGVESGFVTALERVRSELNRLGAGLETVSGRGKGLDSCLQRCLGLGEKLDQLTAEDSGQDIRWYETQRQGFRMNRTPLEVASVFQAQMEGHPAAWIFTSATLAVRNSFQHFERQLGLAGAQTHCWESPFDYPHQALWFVPHGLPEPSAMGYNAAVSDLSARILEASRGRAFLLFTSHRALRAAAEYLPARIDFPLLVQGSAPRSELLERFRDMGNAVLLGTASFWEGVDVRGEALSCVIIDKLPFASPGDPVLQARIDALRQRGGNPFRDFQLPQAVITLKQGAGRLIRDENDRGVLVVCDPRLLSRGYGHAFLDSLPPMRRSREVQDVIDFFATTASAGAAVAGRGTG